MKDECASWCATEEAITAAIMKVERVDRWEALRRMQRRKAALCIRLGTDMPQTGRLISEEDLARLADKFPRPEEARCELTPARAAAFAKCQAARSAKVTNRRSVAHV